MKRFWLLIFCVVAFGGIAHAENIKIKFGVLPVIDTLPLQVAVHDGLFKEQGLDVEIIRFSSALERDTAMQAEQLDGYFGDIIATYLLISKNVPMNIALTSWRTTPKYPMFGVVLSPDKSHMNLADIPNGSVGFSRFTIMDYLADAIFTKHHLESLDRIEVRQIPIRMQMLLTNQLDAALLPEPLMTMAQAKGGKVFTTAENLDIPLTVLCLHRKFFKNGAEVYVNFITAYKEAIMRLQKNPQAYRSVMVDSCRIPPSFIENFLYYPFPLPSLPSHQELDAVQDWMIGKGMIRERIPHEMALSPIIP